MKEFDAAFAAAARFLWNYPPELYNRPFSPVRPNYVFLGFKDFSKSLLNAAVRVCAYNEDGGEYTKIIRATYRIFGGEEPAWYARLKEFLSGCDKGDYLPLPDLPADIISYPVMQTENCGREILSALSGGTDYIICDFGDSEKNVSAAREILKTAEKEGLSLHIFAVCPGCKGEGFIPIDTNIALSDCVPAQRAAVFRRFSRAGGSAGQISGEYLKMDGFARRSNLCSCLSMRQKLLFMGLDCVPLGSVGEPLSRGEYFSVYSGGENNVQYNMPYPPSLRRTLAEREHFRWNAFMLSEGYLPASRGRIMYGRADGKFTGGGAHAVKTHGNITTFNGLYEFGDIVDKKHGLNSGATDVIKYDFTLMDAACDMLSACGYKIIRRKAQS